MSAEQTGSIRRTSLVDEIASRLRHEILEGRWRPGQTLPAERLLARAYGVTRTSLKHALVRLEEAGLIRTRHGIGSIVQEAEESGGAKLLAHLLPAEGALDRKVLAEILEARTWVAMAFVSLAAARRRPRDLAKMDGLLDELGGARDDAVEAQRLENALVRTLAAASGNRAFIFLTNSVSAVYRLDLDTYAEPYRDGAWLEASLRAIVEAVRAKDAGAARAATETYFAENARRVLTKVRAGASKAAGR